MSTKYTTSISVRTGADTITASFDNTEEGVALIDATLAASASDVRYNISFDGSKVKAYAILMSANGTIKVQNGATLLTTLTLLAGVPLVFYYQQGTSANVFNSYSSITHFLFSSTPANTAQVRVLYDPTP